MSLFPPFIVPILAIYLTFGTINYLLASAFLKLYAKLSKEHPEGNVILNQQEKTDFEKWLDK